MQTLKSLIDTHERITVFTGAGISTESGIPDFRSPGGVWTRYQPIAFEDFMASEEMRRESWRRKMGLDKVLQKSKPNRGHHAIAELVRRGKVFSIITQNIDNLHEDSGVDAEQIIELHGNSTYASCLDCKKRFELAPIFEAFGQDETLPVCDACGGIVKTATISFGQSMPEHEMDRAQEATLQCDLFISIGSSLVVYPAAGFPVMAQQNGAKLVILNREATPLDSYAALLVNEEIGAALGDAVGVE